MIENKITTAQVAKDDATIDKYNIDAVTSFLKTLLAGLGEKYKRSSITQLKVLLSSVFPSGITWNYDGTLNSKISTIYQSIYFFSDDAISLSTPSGTMFEPILSR